MLLLGNIFMEAGIDIDAVYLMDKMVESINKAFMYEPSG